jgi:hypothetical protein
MMRLHVIGLAFLAAAATFTGHATATRGATFTGHAAATAIAGPPPGFIPDTMQEAGHHADHTPVLCQAREWEWLPSGLVAYNDVFAGRYSECISVRPSGFKIIRARTGWEWGAFPDVFLGCEYNVCSRTPLPQRPIADYTNLTMTLYTRFDAVAGDDTTDWWFDRARPGRSRSHPNGAEIMVWLAWREVPMRGGYVVRLDHQYWYIEHWRAYADHTYWQYIQMRWLGSHPNPSLRLNMLPFLRYFERRGWLRPSWYPSSLDAGFEVIHGGVGNRIIKYAVSIRVR